jgi:RNA polymerase sigma factor (sigma-70 family)
VSVVNACRSWHRSRAREERRLRVVTSPTESSLGADELLDAVGQLPYAQRAALVLRYYEHCNEAEIAEILGIPRNTVKSHLRRGIAALRQAVDE